MGNAISEDAEERLVTKAEYGSLASTTEAGWSTVDEGTIDSRDDSYRYERRIEDERASSEDRDDINKAHRLLDTSTEEGGGASNGWTTEESENVGERRTSPTKSHLLGGRKNKRSPSNRMRSPRSPRSPRSGLKRQPSVSSDSISAFNGPATDSSSDRYFIQSPIKRHMGVVKVDEFNELIETTLAGPVDPPTEPPTDPPTASPPRSPSYYRRKNKRGNISPAKDRIFFNESRPTPAITKDMENSKMQQMLATFAMELAKAMDKNETSTRSTERTPLQSIDKKSIQDAIQSTIGAGTDGEAVPTRSYAIGNERIIDTKEANYYTTNYEESPRRDIRVSDTIDDTFEIVRQNTIKGVESNTLESPFKEVGNKTVNRSKSLQDKGERGKKRQNQKRDDEPNPSLSSPRRIASLKLVSPQPSAPIPVNRPLSRSSNLTERSLSRNATLTDQSSSRNTKGTDRSYRSSSQNPVQTTTQPQNTRLATDGTLSTHGMSFPERALSPMSTMTEHTSQNTILSPTERIALALASRQGPSSVNALSTTESPLSPNSLLSPEKTLLPKASAAPQPVMNNAAAAVGRMPSQYTLSTTGHNSKNNDSMVATEQVLSPNAVLTRSEPTVSSNAMATATLLATEQALPSNPSVAATTGPTSSGISVTDRTSSGNVLSNDQLLAIERTLLSTERAPLNDASVPASTSQQQVVINRPSATNAFHTEPALTTPVTDNALRPVQPLSPAEAALSPTAQTLASNSFSTTTTCSLAPEPAMPANRPLSPAIMSLNSDDLAGIDLHFVEQYVRTFDSFLTANPELVKKNPEMVAYLRVAKLQKLLEDTEAVEDEMTKTYHASQKQKSLMSKNYQDELLQASKDKAARGIQLQLELNKIQQCTKVLEGKMSWDIVLRNKHRAEAQNSLLQKVWMAEVDVDYPLASLPRFKEARAVSDAAFALIEKDVVVPALEKMDETRKLQLENAFLSAEISVLESKLGFLKTSSEKHAWVDPFLRQMSLKNLNTLKERYQKKIGKPF